LTSFLDFNGASLTTFKSPSWHFQISNTMVMGHPRGFHLVCAAKNINNYQINKLFDPEVVIGAQLIIIEE
jgi:hypothetical protein